LTGNVILTKATDKNSIISQNSKSDATDEEVDGDDEKPKKSSPSKHVWIASFLVVIFAIFVCAGCYGAFRAHINFKTIKNVLPHYVRVSKTINAPFVFLPPEERHNYKDDSVYHSLDDAHGGGANQ
jgi:hypothetical protein